MHVAIIEAKTVRRQEASYDGENIQRTVLNSLWSNHVHQCEFTVGVVPNSLQDIGRASDGAKRRPVAGGLGRSVET